MALKIAVATTDGIVVNQHFGRADRFLIVEVDDSRTVVGREVRTVEPVCDGGNHDDNRLERQAELLSDCDAVLVSRIGPGARQALERRGVDVYELPGIIEESVNRMIDYMEVQKLLDSMGVIVERDENNEL